MAENSNPSGRYRSAKELKQIVKEDKGQPMPDLGSPEEWGEFERALGGRKIIQPVAPKPEEVEKNKLESKIDNIVDKINEKFDDTEKQLDKALGDGIITEAQRNIFVKSLENHASLFDRYDKGERSDELLQLLIDYLQKINEGVEDLLIRKSVPLPPEKLPIEKKKEKVVAAKIIGKEELFPGELVADLKNKYLELFRLRKEKENLPEQLPNEIAEIKKQIREFYRQKGLKGLNYRLQIGEIIEKIKIDAEREVGHKKADSRIKKEKAKIEPRAQEKKEERPEYDLPRKGAEITLARIKNYDELWAQTEQEGDEKFKEKTRELWKEFAVHGKIGYDEEGNITLTNDTDLDGRGCIYLMQAAGFDTTNLKYIEHGNFAEDKIYFDVGDVHGVVLKDGGKKVFIDHHTDESGRESSATKFTYELLTSLGLLKKEKYLDNLIDFITRVDNKDYFSDEENFRNSWKTIYGLHYYIDDFSKIIEIFKAGVKPGEALSHEDLKKLILEGVSKRQEKTINVSVAKMKKIEEGGLVVPSERFGKIVVDIGKKVGAGYDAVRAFGYQTYVIWNPETKSFFITSKERLDKEKFGQGRSVRGHMWIKPRQDKEPLKVKLADILNTLTDGKFEPAGKLKEFIEKEDQEEKFMETEELKFLQRLGLKYLQALDSGADWSGYTDEQKNLTLKIQTEIFLTGELKKKTEDDKAIQRDLEFLMGKIIK